MAKTKTVSLALLTSLLLLAMLSFGSLNVEAQSQATVEIVTSIGGTTDPAPGNHTYDDGATLTVTANPTAAEFTFDYWVISADSTSRTSFENPLSFPVTGGTTYHIQPVFQVLQPIGVPTLPSDMSSAAIVIVLAGVGGTTDPTPGSYAFSNATSLDLKATPDSGWMFSHWVISGETNMDHGGAPVNLEPTDNPYNVNHGYGATYYYQPVFTQTSNPTPSPSIPEFSVIAVLLLLVALVPVVLVARKNKISKSSHV